MKERCLFQSSQLSEVKECLRVATDQEESLRRFNDELMAKVSASVNYIATLSPFYSGTPCFGHIFIFWT